jgi:hypothetical protein
MVHVKHPHSPLAWHCVCLLQRLAVLRLDGDMYQSTWETYQHLYNRLSVGAYVVVDDFALPGSRAATLDFRSFFGLHKDTLLPIDNDGAYWRRSAGPTMAGPSTSKWPLYAQLLRSNSLVCIVTGAALARNTDSPILLAVDDKVTTLELVPSGL